MSFDIWDGDEIESVFGSSPEDNIDLESNNREYIHTNYNPVVPQSSSDQNSIQAILFHRPKKAKGAFEQINAGDTIRVVQGRGKHLRLSITTPVECDWRSFCLSTIQSESTNEKPEILPKYSIKLGNVAVCQFNPNQDSPQFKATVDFQLIATTNTSKSIYFRAQVASFVGTILECQTVTFKTSHSQSSTAQPATKKRRLDTSHESIAPNLSVEPSPVHSPHSENNTNVPPPSTIVMPTSLDVHGSVRAHSFHQFSDLRLKTNIEEIVDALHMVTQLQGVRYQWRPDALPGLDHRERVLGLIAQQVQEVFPEAVKHEENGYLSVNYSDMVPVLIQAVKQLANQQKESEGDLVAMRMTLNDVVVWMSIRKKIGDYEEDENQMAATRLDRYKERQLQALDFDPNERQALVDQISELRIKIEGFDSKVIGHMSRWHPIQCSINPTRSTKIFIIIVVVTIVVLAVAAYIVFGPKK